MNPIQSRRSHAGPLAAGLATAVALVVMVTAAQADGLNTNSPLLPPLGGEYLSPAGVHATYNGPGLQIVLSNVRHRGFSNVVATPVPGGTLENFASEATGSVAVDIGPDSFFDIFFDIELTGPTSVMVGSGYTPGALGTFETEMLQLDLSGNTPFGVALIRESPTKQSTGQTKVTDIGGGLYHIDSFFDVFTELSLDGGANWMPSTGTVYVTLVPEPSSLVCLTCGAIALAAGFARRRRNLRAK